MTTSSTCSRNIATETWITLYMTGCPRLFKSFFYVKTSLTYKTYKLAFSKISFKNKSFKSRSVDWISLQFLLFVVKKHIVNDDRARFINASYLCGYEATIIAFSSINKVNVIIILAELSFDECRGSFTVHSLAIADYWIVATSVILEEILSKEFQTQCKSH